MRKKNKLTLDDKTLFREHAGKVQPVKDDKIPPEPKKTPLKKLYRECITLTITFKDSRY